MSPRMKSRAPERSKISPTPMQIPPTRNHHQLARWVNERGLVDDQGRAVVARVERVTTSTDTKVAGTRFRRPGRGRRGLVLKIWLARVPESQSQVWPQSVREALLFSHESSETYRRHAEARAWIEQNLRPRDRSPTIDNEGDAAP